MEKKYTFLQKLLAIYNNTTPEWFYATDLEKAIMSFEYLSEKEKEDFFKEIGKKNPNE